MKRFKIFLRSSVVVLALALVALSLWHMKGMNHDHSKMEHPALVPPEGFQKLEPFELLNQDGEKFGTENLKGNIWLANFIFTRCAGPCPIMSGKMAGLQEEYGSNNKLKFISFSVDPDYDTPSVLKKYAKIYGAKNNWHFLTSTRKIIYDLIQNQFRLAVKESEFIPSDNEEMQILHSLHFVLVNEQGEVQGYYNSSDGEAISDLKIKLTALLAPPS